MRCPVTGMPWQFVENPPSANWKSVYRSRSQWKKSDNKLIGDLVEDRIIVSRKRNKQGKMVHKVEGGIYIDLKDTWYGKTAEGETVVKKKASVFTFTSKMSCASFSLPAGHPNIEGTCESAARGRVEKEGSYRRFHAPLSQIPADQKYICHLCYAGKGNYYYVAPSAKQMIILNWTKRELRRGTFVDQMVYAISTLFEPEAEEKMSSQLVSNKFFRLHDSGDFSIGDAFGADYYRAWCQIARRFNGKTLPKVLFWAPTRLWTFARWRSVFKRFPPPDNLALRPSALFTGAPPPRGVAKLAAGTMSAVKRVRKGVTISEPLPRGVYDCPAYAGAKEKSCASSNCRVCWKAKKRAVNYTTH